jgi:hypothetical protein
MVALPPLLAGALVEALARRGALRADAGGETIMSRRPRLREGGLLWWGWRITETLAWAAGLALLIILALAAGPHAGGS